VDVSLRKAAQIRTAIAGRIQAINLRPQVTLSVYDEHPYNTLRVAQQAFQADLALVTRLEDVLYAVRAAIGRANSEIGLDDLLAEKAKLDLRLARLQGVAQMVPPRQDLVLAKLEVARAKLASPDGHLGYGEEEQAVFAVTEVDVVAAKAMMVLVKRDLRAIGNQLLDHNVRGTVAIPDEDYTFLQEQGVI
jgi:hypothetical protein